MLAFVAAAVRGFWLLRMGTVINNEGSEFARLAENLLDGRGYVGVFGGPHEMMAPLYPILIAILTPLAGGSSYAAFAVSFATGIGLVLVAYAIGGELGGRAVAISTGLLAAIHGLFVGLSAVTFSEGTFFYAVAIGMLLTLRAMVHPTNKRALWAGIAFATAYLIRPEALAYGVVAAVFVTVSGVVQRRSLRPHLASACVLVAAMVLVGSPYSAWLTAKSGHFRVEGKSISNGIIAARMVEGMSYHEAARGLDPETGAPAGPYLFADQFEADGLAARYQGVSMAGRMSRDLFGRVRSIVREVTDLPSLGGVVFMGLALLGAGVSARRNRAWLGAAFVVCLGGVYVLALLTMEHRWSRHMFPLAFFALPLAGVGAAAVWNGVDLAAQRLGIASVRWRNALALALSAVVLFAVARPSWSGAESEFGENQRTILREAGDWLRANGAQGRLIMGYSGVIAYYAQATLTYLPWASSPAALRYIHAESPSYVVLWSGASDKTPYTGQWLESGIPDACANLVGDLKTDGERVAVYEWHCAQPQDS